METIFFTSTGSFDNISNFCSVASPALFRCKCPYRAPIADTNRNMKDLCGDTCHGDLLWAATAWKASRLSPVELLPDLLPALPNSALWGWAAMGGQDIHELPLPTSADMVMSSLQHYDVTYFNNLEQPLVTADYPVVEIEYPRGLDKFILVSPKLSDYYDPINECREALETISRYYCIPSQLRNLGLKDLTFTQSLSTAIAERNGPAFMEIVTRFNSAMRELKTRRTPSIDYLAYPVNSWTATGIPKPVLFRILEEAYQRGVAPNAKRLNKTGPNPTLAYGELTPPLLYDILQLADVTHRSTFLDLGSGVGNVVIQASLQTGCRSHGIEINSISASVADKHLQVFSSRCDIWGVRSGPVQLECGDMTKSCRLKELLHHADVVFVNNERFDPVLNQTIVEMLDVLKDGARVISLRPLGMSVHASFTDRDVKRNLIPFCITQHSFHPQDTSWTYKDEGCYYYLHRLNRREYRKIQLRSEVRSLLKQQLTCK